MSSPSNRSHLIWAEDPTVHRTGNGPLHQHPTIAAALTDGTIHYLHAKAIADGHTVITTADPTLDNDTQHELIAALLHVATHSIAKAVTDRAHELAHHAATQARARYDAEHKQRTEEKKNNPPEDTDVDSDGADGDGGDGGADGVDGDGGGGGGGADETEKTPDVDDAPQGPPPLPVSENTALNELHIYPLANGRNDIRGNYDKLTTERLKAALSPHAAPRPGPDGTRDPRTPARRNADALADIIARHLRGGMKASGAPTADVKLIVRLADLLKKPPSNGRGEGPGGESPCGAGPSRQGPSGGGPRDESPNGGNPSNQGPSGGSPSGQNPSGGGPRDGSPNGRSPNGGSPSRQDPSGGVPRDESPNGGSPNGGSPSRQTPFAVSPSGQDPCDGQPHDGSCNDDGSDNGSCGSDGCGDGCAGGAGRSDGRGGAIPQPGDADWPFHLDWTGPISRYLAEFLACDALLTPVIVDHHGVPLALGRSERLATPELRDAVIIRDRCCVMCGRPPQWCQTHHIQYWHNGGPTDLDNLALVCPECHRQIHNTDWQLLMGHDGHPYAIPPIETDPQQKPILSYHRRRKRSA